MKDQMNYEHTMKIRYALWKIRKSFNPFNFPLAIIYYIHPEYMLQLLFSSYIYIRKLFSFRKKKNETELNDKNKKDKE